MNLLSYLRHCFLRSHARGKEVARELETVLGREVVTYACPRCGARWSRKVYRQGKKSAPSQAQ